jgi:protein TorT
MTHATTFTRRATRLAAFACLAFSALTSVSAQTAGDPWQFPVMVMDPPRKTGIEPFDGKRQTYTALSRKDVSKKWNICALFPHTTNDIVRAYLYGTVEEVKRLGAKLTILDAGGYGKVDKQLAQFDDCMTLGADAILLFAVSSNGLNPKISEARAKGVKVIDLNVGVGAQADARVVVTYQSVGQLLGRTLAQKHPKGSGKVSVVLMPGPAGIPWAEDTVIGFKKALSESDVVLEKVIYGQSGRLDQQPLVEDALVTYPQLKYLVGMGTSVEAALNTLRERGKQGQVGLYASFVTNDLMSPLRNGDVLGAVVENSVVINRLAVDMAVRSLENKLTVKDAVPDVTLVTKENAGTIGGNNFAPQNWKSQMKVD